MGETQNQPFQLSFNPSLKVDFQGSRVTSDGGLLLLCELDEHLGSNQRIEENLTDDRQGKRSCRLAASFGEGRRTVGETRTLLLAAAGGRTLEPAAVRRDAEPDWAAAGAYGIAEVGPRFVSKSITASWVGGRRGVAKSQAEPGVIALPWRGFQLLGRLPG